MTFDKVQYRKNREDGKRGQGELKKPTVHPNLGDKAERAFDNDGNMIVKNRAYRRRKLTIPGSNVFTKNTIPERKLQAHRKVQAKNLRREAREVKKEKIENGR